MYVVKKEESKSAQLVERAANTKRQADKPTYTIKEEYKPKAQ